MGNDAWLSIRQQCEWERHATPLTVRMRSPTFNRATCREAPHEDEAVRPRARALPPNPPNRRAGQTAILTANLQRELQTAY